jgi:hypothetical protein
MPTPSHLGRTMPAAIPDDIVQAERQVALCERNLDNQRQMFAELKAGGHDTAGAAYLIREYEDLLRLHIRDRDRLRKELRARHHPSRG